MISGWRAAAAFAILAALESALTNVQRGVCAIGWQPTQAHRLICSPQKKIVFLWFFYWFSSDKLHSCVFPDFLANYCLLFLYLCRWVSFV